MMQEQGLTNVGDLLDEDPAVRGSTTTSNPGFSASMYDNPGQILVNLRNLGSGTNTTPARTLVLIDGQRVVPNTEGGGVDLNTIPSILLDHTEIVTGGASAQYGSDAVAGVVNLILKKNFNGFQADISYGESTYGDDRQPVVQALYGHDFFGGHLMIGGEYSYSEGTQNVFSNPRGWLKQQYGIVTGAGNARYYTNHVELSQTSYGGLITGCQVGATANANCALRGIAFQPDGTPYNFVYGNQYGAPTTATSIGASNMSGGSNTNDTQAESPPYMDPNEHFSMLARYDHQLTEHISASVTFNMELLDSNHNTVEPRDPSTITAANLVIQNTNPYLPASVAALMATNHVTAFNLSRAEIDIGPFEVRDTAQVYQGGVDFKGDFANLIPFGANWTWDAHGGFGSNLQVTKLLNNRIDANFLNAFNAVAGPNGPMCASATARAAGCQPFNPFGLNQFSQASAAYFQGTSWHHQVEQRTDFTANVRGDPFSTWAGKVSVAFGGEYRIDTINVTDDPTSAAAGWDVNNIVPIGGRISVGEIYGEAVVPLLSGMTFAKEVDFDGAVREADYNLSGATTTYKAGLTWQVNDDIRFRISDSRDVRAPNVAELFQARTQAPLGVNVILPGSPLTQNVFSTSLTSGNQNLKPEQADTVSYGVGLSPRFLPGFRASVDYYDIRIQGAIASYTGQQIVTNCQAGIAVFCPYLHIDPNSGAVSENIEPFNINSIKTNGVDFDVSYQTPLSRWFGEIPGSVRASWQANYVQHLITTGGGVSFDGAGTTGGVFVTGTGTPNWTSFSNLTYTLGPASFNFNARYVGQAVFDRLALPGGPDAGLLSLNHVPGRFYFGLGLQYDIPHPWVGSDIQLYGSIHNLLNSDPPNFGLDRSLDDTLGRYFTVGLRLRM